MSSKLPQSLLLITLGFAAGASLGQLPWATAAETPADGANLADREFMISVDEIRENFVFAERFRGSYQGEFKLSDGSTRRIELTPMLHEGRQVLELKDSGGRTYMGLNGTNTNGTLMIQVRDVAAMQALNAQAGG